MVVAWWTVKDLWLTSEETRAALDTAGFLSTIACFMYLSIDCIIDAYKIRGKKQKS